eukprot:TRINITY_DN9007_c0_g1_i2.p1 TRINITY_DN9007_c0_g1~~TRINITY_DN9007_c0_g1_i2.p1  ORF type:complete len:473 (+),score=28.42 TRINITY_DN9007_c0_g1_i2:491-1909(+)
MQLILCAVAAIEGADSQLLGSAMKALQEDIGLKLTQISYLTIAQLVLANLAAPLWGILADRGILQRRTILISASVGQGCVVILLAFMPSLIPMVLCRAIDGALLAALRPISNGIVADVTVEQRRGKIFGRMQSSLIMGMFLSSLLVVPMSTRTVFGLNGWRVAFTIIGCLTLAVAGLVACILEEPPRAQSFGDSEHNAIWSELKTLFHFFRMPTFVMMILQGIFGTIPWSVMGFMVLFFQLSGISNVHAAVLAGAQAISGALGNLAGGLIADRFAICLGLHGRPLVAQVTVALGIPIMYAVFVGISPGQGSFELYLSLVIAFGLCATWAQSGTNFPILTHIVPASCRSRVLAWEGALENSIAFGLGPVIVSWLSETIFGYRFGHDVKEGIDLESAQALGRAMASVICLPWVVCFLVYGTMHLTYPWDLARLGSERGESVIGSDVANHGGQESTPEGEARAHSNTNSLVAIDV